MRCNRNVWKGPHLRPLCNETREFLKRLPAQTIAAGYYSHTEELESPLSNLKEIAGRGCFAAFRIE